MNIGCQPKGWPSACQITATTSPTHIAIVPPILVVLSQNKPARTGANKLETNIAAPVTQRLTSCGIYRAKNKENTCNYPLK